LIESDWYPLDFTRSFIDFFLRQNLDRQAAIPIEVHSVGSSEENQRLASEKKKGIARSTKQFRHTKVSHSSFVHGDAVAGVAIDDVHRVIDRSSVTVAFDRAQLNIDGF
jgi:hypothetical protein